MQSPSDEQIKGNLPSGLRQLSCTMAREDATEESVDARRGHVVFERSTNCLTEGELLSVAAFFE